MIEIDPKITEIHEFLGVKLGLQKVFGGHIGSRDLEMRSKVTLSLL